MASHPDDGGGEAVRREERGARSHRGRLRIWLVAACPFPARRGTPLRIERLSEALERLGHEVEVVSYGIEEPGSSTSLTLHRALDPPRSGTIAPGPTPSKLLRLDPLLARRLRRLLKRRPPDVLHAHHIEALLAAAWARRGLAVPLVYDAHTLIATELPSYAPAPLRTPLAAAGRLCDRLASRLADGVVGVTGEIVDHFASALGFPQERMTAALNGVEVEHFAVARNRAQPWRIVYTGTLAAYQDVDLLLAAFARARAADPRLRLRLCVSGDAEQLRSALARFGIADSVEVEPDDFERLPERLAECQIAALPRRHCPGLPQKLLNYMAAGLAVVASRGAAKVIQHGRTGLVVENGDVAGFARALLALAADPERARALGCAAQDWIRRHHSWDAAAARVEALYRRLLEDPMRPYREPERSAAGDRPAGPLPFDARSG